MKTEREIFEELAYSKKWNIFRVRDMGLDRYVDDFVDGAWHGWQASANREGYKLVPVEPKFETMQTMHLSLLENEGETNKYKMQEIYKAMIGAVNEH